MTATANQLIAKALSTASEDEAIACLRMARKRGAKMSDSTQTTQKTTSCADHNEVKRWQSIANDWKNLYFSVKYTSETNSETARKYMKQYNEIVIKNDSKTISLVFTVFGLVVSTVINLHLSGVF